MKLTVKTVVIAGGVLVGLIAAGCGTPAGGPGGPGGAGQVTVAGCTTYGVQAIEHHIIVTRRPAACRGLSRAEVNQAAAMAVRRVAGGAPKAVWRRRAAEAAAFLSHLVTGPAPASGALPAGPPAGPAVSVAPGGRDLAMDLAALAAWIVTAGSGAYVLGTWLLRGGTLRPRADVAGSPPAVVFGHFGLALGGLAIWIAYLIADWAPLGWTAVGVLVPVAGLGMATLATGLPGRVPDSVPAPVVAAGVGLRAGGETADGSSGGPGSIGPAGIGLAGIGTDGVGPDGAATDGIGRGIADQVTARGRLSLLVVAGHGVLAVTTMLLVLLAALGTAAG